MASAPEEASIQDLVSMPNVASVQDVVSVTDVASVAGASVPDGISIPNGTSATSSAINGLSATSIVPDDKVNFPMLNRTPTTPSVPGGSSETLSTPKDTSATSSIPGDPVNSPISNDTSATLSILDKPIDFPVSNGISAISSASDGSANFSVSDGTSATSSTSSDVSITSSVSGDPVIFPTLNGTSTTSLASDDPISFPIANGASATSPNPESLSVAINGGGIGGICLALGLLKHPHIDFQVYEATPEWVQIGAGLGLGPNASAALELLGPETEAAFRKNVTGNLWESHKKTFMNFFAGQGPNAGQLIHTQKSSTGLQSCQRVHLVKDLVESVPADRVHMGKRLVHIQDKYWVDEPVILHFADGTTATADAVIGADGIHSYVREVVMGKEEAKPIFSGFVAYRGLLPMDLAIEKLGAEVAQNTTIFCGPGGALLSSSLDRSKVVIAAANPEVTKWEHEKWNVPAGSEELDPLFEGWGPQARALVELLKGPDLAKWAIWDSALAPTYTKGRVALIGDAAHATTPWQGQGAGQALEDALVLKHLLTDSSTSPNRAQLPNVFYAYDQIRRPRTQRIITTSREAGMLFSMRTPGVEGDLKKMSEELGKRMNWIWHRDLKAQNRAAAELFLESL